jgi:hypothetical protein
MDNNHRPVVGYERRYLHSISCVVGAKNQGHWSVLESIWIIADVDGISEDMSYVIVSDPVAPG